jgi:hypothetical protein
MVTMLHALFPDFFPSMAEIPIGTALEILFLETVAYILVIVRKRRVTW